MSGDRDELESTVSQPAPPKYHRKPSYVVNHIPLGMSGSNSKAPPRASFDRRPSQPSRTVAYMRRKSTAILKSPSARSVRLGSRPRSRRSRPGGAGARPAAGPRAPGNPGHTAPRGRPRPRPTHVVASANSLNGRYWAAAVTFTLPSSRTSPGSAVSFFRTSPVFKRRFGRETAVTLIVVFAFLFRPST
jgi:hypothetical protein